MIVGINATKEAVFIAETTGNRENFTIAKITRLQFGLACVQDMAELLRNLKILLAALAPEMPTVALLCCSSGQYGSSLEAIKAETLAQLAAHECGYEVMEVKPQSLKSTLNCAKAEKWQSKAKDMFNSAGNHKHWAQGANGAVSAAYKATLA
jgi:hypothetical protein